MRIRAEISKQNRPEDAVKTVETSRRSNYYTHNNKIIVGPNYCNINKSREKSLFLIQTPIS
jgi:hypothetical protein